jgi:hypothetical protein
MRTFAAFANFGISNGECASSDKHAWEAAWQERTAKRLDLASFPPVQVLPYDRFEFVSDFGFDV